MAIEAVSDIKRAGTSAFAAGGPGGTPQVFIQSTQPADTGVPYIWIQTGLPNGGWSVWYNETGTT